MNCNQMILDSCFLCFAKIKIVNLFKNLKLIKRKKGTIMIFFTNLFKRKKKKNSKLKDDSNSKDNSKAKDNTKSFNWEEKNNQEDENQL